MADSRVQEGWPGDPAARLELAATLLTTPSDAEAVLAYSLLRPSLAESQLVALANLRELIALLPAPPFCPPVELETLGFSAYESTGHSMRRLFESDHGIFGIEFTGLGSLCSGASVLTTSSRFSLHPDSESALDETMLEVFMNHELVFDVIADAASLLGLGFPSRPYTDVDDFPATHAAAAAGQAFGELF